MLRSFTARWGLVLGLLIVALIAAIAIIPGRFTNAANEKTKGLFKQTSSLDPDIPRNWDIREQKGEAVADLFAKYRQNNQKDASAVADLRESFVRGEETFKAKHPDAVVEYNTDIRTPEVLSPNVQRQKFNWLTGKSKADRVGILRGFIKQNESLVGLNDTQIDTLDVAADYTNPSGNMSFVHLEQKLNGVPVFRGEVKAGFTTNNQIIRVINNLAPGVDSSSVSTDFGDPTSAVRTAAAHIRHDLKAEEFAPNAKGSTDLKVVFGSGDWATTAEKMYFPTEPGVAVPAWRVLIWQPVNAYYVIVDANNDAVLWHKNLTDDQTQAAQYQVYNNTNAFVLAAESPSTLTPGPINPTLNTQGTLGTRTNVSLIGNEGPLSFNNNGWITDGANITDGNAVEAGVDRDGVNGVDATQVGSPNRVFTSTWNPPPGSPAPGDDPLLAQSQRGAVIQMFYVMNRYHDALYQLGFNEAARNYQAVNFTGQGLGNDRISAEGQDSSGTNNANFSVVADGSRGRMQMYLWTGPTPDYDGTTDAEVILHEVTHGTSQRLHGNASGLSTNMANGMGEGWGDFFGEAMLAEPTDPIDAVYTTGGYATYLLSGMQSNYYYGIRRFPRAPITFLGPNGKPHNPFTFQYLNSNCDTLIGTTGTNPNSAYPRNPVVSTSSASQACDQVHNAGEVWSSALWEVRNRMVTRLGFTAGTSRVLQVVLDGMKLAPLGPTFLQERDSITAAAAALPLAPEALADVADVRNGFRVRGMGFSASIQNAGTGANNTAVTEAFDVPNALFVGPYTASDILGDHDGYPEPGEVILVSVPITNNSGAAIANVVASITGGNTANYGTINDGQTVTKTISFVIPAAAACGSQQTVNFTGASALGALNPASYTFTLGAPVGGAPATFTSSTPFRIPGTGTGPGTADVYPTTLNVAGLSGQKKIKLELTNLSTTYPGDMDLLLVGPGGQKFVIMSDVISAFTTQTNAVVTLTDDAAAGLPDVGSVSMNGSWKPTDWNTGTDTWGAPAPAAPYTSPAPTGVATFASVFGSDGAAMNGTWSLYAADDVSGDFATVAGWKLTFEANDYVCSLATAAQVQVSGRVLADSERGLTNARVALTDELGNSRVVVTGRGGAYSFADVEAGHTYVISISARRYSYSPRVIQVSDNLTGVDFTPEH